jgi:hypothetical protein
MIHGTDPAVTDDFWPKMKSNQETYDPSSARLLWRFPIEYVFEVMDSHRDEPTRHDAV